MLQPFNIYQLLLPIHHHIPTHTTHCKNINNQATPSSPPIYSPASVSTASHTQREMSCQSSKTSSMQLTHLYSFSPSSVLICLVICFWNCSSSLQFLNTGSMHLSLTMRSTLPRASPSSASHSSRPHCQLYSRRARVSSPGPMEERPFMQLQKDLVSIISSLQQLNTAFMYMILRSRQKLRNFPRLTRRSPARSSTSTPTPNGSTPTSTLPSLSSLIFRQQASSTALRQALKISSGSTSSYSSISKSKSRMSLRIYRELGLIFWLKREKTRSGDWMKEGSSLCRKDRMSKSVICLNSKGRSMQGLKREQTRGLVYSSSTTSAMRMFSIFSCISSAHSRRRRVLASSLATEEDCSNSSFRDIWMEEEDSQLLMLTSYQSNSLKLLLEAASLKLTTDSLYSYSCSLSPSLNSQQARLPLLPSVWLLGTTTPSPEGGEVGQMGCSTSSLLYCSLPSSNNSGACCLCGAKSRSMFLKVTSESMERRMRVSAEKLFLTLEATRPCLSSSCCIWWVSSWSWIMLSLSWRMLRMQSSLHLSRFLSYLRILPSSCSSWPSPILPRSSLYFEQITLSISMKMAGESPSVEWCFWVTGESSDSLLVKHSRGVSCACILQYVSSWLLISLDAFSSLLLKRSITKLMS